MISAFVLRVVSRWPLPALLAVVAGSRPAYAHQTAPIALSGPLAAVPCKNHGDIEIAGAHVAFGETVTCVATDAEVRIQDTHVAEGSTFYVRSEPHGAAGPAPWADTMCSSGDLNCNVCATDVVAQFKHLSGEDLPPGAELSAEENYEWSFDRNQSYPPSGSKPKNALEQAAVDYHFQGFVRTNSSSVPFAGTYSHSDTGSIFFVEVSGLKLGALHDAWTGHPSGASVLGDFLLFGDYSSHSPRAVRLIPVSDHLEETMAQLLIPPFDVKGQLTEVQMGGGVGMVKLTSGGYMLISSGPGGPTFTSDEKDDPKPRFSDFHYVRANPNAAGTAVSPLGTILPASNGALDLTPFYMGRWTQVYGEGASAKKYQYSENLTVISECETGDVYVMHASMLDPHKLIIQPGYWRLSRVGWNGTQPYLEQVDVFEQDQDWESCYIRSVGTAWVNPSHEIELYCHDYRVGPLEEKILFRRRVVNY
ncbi:MAG TPA: hypothetical protein VK524_28050 [Polyangiaceae bacterium]|nr:hypothetical protein [Polyangiaceae bacterium]